MAMFKSNPMYCGDPGMVVVAGSVVAQNPAAAAANTIVPNVLTRTNFNAAGAGIGQGEAVAPQGAKVTAVINPTTAYAPQVATGANQNVVMLDLRAYPGDIVCVQASCVPAPSATPGALTLGSLDATVVGIDQSNNFVYILTTSGGGGANAFLNGISLHYVVFFKDTYTP